MSDLDLGGVGRVSASATPYFLLIVLFARSRGAGGARRCRANSSGEGGVIAEGVPGGREVCCVVFPLHLTARLRRTPNIGAAGKDILNYVDATFLVHPPEGEEGSGNNKTE